MAKLRKDEQTENLYGLGPLTYTWEGLTENDIWLVTFALAAKAQNGDIRAKNLLDTLDLKGA